MTPPPVATVAPPADDADPMYGDALVHPSMYTSTTARRPAYNIRHCPPRG